MQTLLTASDLE